MILTWLSQLRLSEWAHTDRYWSAYRTRIRFAVIICWRCLIGFVIRLFHVHRWERMWQVVGLFKKLGPSWYVCSKQSFIVFMAQYLLNRISFNVQLSKEVFKKKKLKVYFLNRMNEIQNGRFEFLFHAWHRLFIPKTNAMNIPSNWEKRFPIWLRQIRLASWWIDLREQIEPLVFLDVFLFEQTLNQWFNIGPFCVKIFFTLRF